MSHRKSLPSRQTFHAIFKKYPDIKERFDSEKEKLKVQIKELQKPLQENLRKQTLVLQYRVLIEYDRRVKLEKATKHLQ